MYANDQGLVQVIKRKYAITITGHLLKGIEQRGETAHYEILVLAVALTLMSLLFGGNAQSKQCFYLVCYEATMRAFANEIMFKTVMFKHNALFRIFSTPPYFCRILQFMR